MKVLIVGLGSIARKHIKALKELYPDTIIYALRHSNSGVNFPQVQNIYNWKELKVKPDFIIISNPSSEHYLTLKECLTLRVPLFIEKPLFHELNNGLELIDQITQLGIKTYIACFLRFHPVIRYLKRTIEQKNKLINEVNIYCGSYLPDWRPGTNFRNSYSASKVMGGGVHLDLIHEIDYVYYLFGKPQKTHKILRSKSTLNIDAVDYANYCLEYKNFAVNIILNYFRRDPKREIEIVFEDITLSGDLITSEIKDGKNNIIFEDDTILHKLYIDQLEYFINTDNPMNNINEAWDVLNILLQ
jgi:predicted dehydrogenase